MRYLLSIILCLWASCAWAFPPGFIGAVTQGAGTSATFMSDTFTDSPDKLLTAHTGEGSITWTSHTNNGANFLEISSSDGRVRIDTTTVALLYYASTTPSSANYYVEADVYMASTSTTAGLVDIAGRMDTTNSTAYWVRYSAATSEIKLYKTVSGSTTQLGSTYTISPPVANGSTHTIRLEMNGSSILAKYDDSTVITQTNSDITSAGKVGLRAFSSAEASCTEPTSIEAGYL